MKNTDSKSNPKANGGSVQRMVGLRRCSCGLRPKLTRWEGGVEIECRLGMDEGCGDYINEATEAQARAAWNQ
jgi:hypothetical protein